MNSDYITLYIDDKIYIQRTSVSKFVEFSLEGEKICTYNELPQQIQDIINQFKAMEEYPDDYFLYKEYDGELTLTCINTNYPYIKIPEYIHGMPVKELGISIVPSDFENDIKQIILPNTLESLDVRTFTYCTSLEHINIPSKVKTIPAYCFEYCYNLKNIDVSSVDRIESGAFLSCKKMKNIDISHIESLGESVFSRSGLRKIKLPRLEKIPSSSFMGCMELKEVIIPYGVKEIGSMAFANCHFLSDINFPDSIEVISNGAFQSTGNLKFIGSKSLQKIENYAFSGSNIRKVSLEDCTKIEKTSFNGCTFLTEINAPEELKRIIEENLEEEELPFH